MARDEALLKSCLTSDFAPVLRFYSWSPATISLGYFQDFSEFEELPPPAGELDVVRRTTGGGAILHDIEITYSITFPIKHPLIDGRPNHLYTLAHDAIIAAVGGDARPFGCGNDACGSSPHRGPFFCFARRHALDVVIPDANDPTGTRKLAGSAQRRTQTAILQHGSIMLDSRFPQQPLASWSEVRGEPIDFKAAARLLTRAFEDTLQFAFEVSEWTTAELTAADIHIDQYAGDPWTKDRKRPDR